MNAPVKIQIDAATKRKADLWDALQAGEIDAHEAHLIDAALSAYAETKRNEASGLDALARRYALRGMTGPRVEAIYQTSREINLIASRAEDIRDKFLDGGNSYIMPGDV